MAEHTTEDRHTRILDLVHEDAWAEVSAALKRCDPADTAEIIGRAAEDVRPRLFALVDDDRKPDVLAELETVAGADVLEALTNPEIAELVEEMAPDDAADLLGDLPEVRSENVLDLMETEEAQDVRKLLTYKEDTAGGIMTTDVVAMQANQTVGEALHEIAYLDTREPFYTVNVVDEDGRLIGQATIWELLRERERERPLKDIARGDFAAATVDMDQEEVAGLMAKYDLAVLPVMDPTGRLVGRITSDDVMDVIEEEASEDILRLAGSDDAELEAWSTTKSCFVRLPWLLITLLGGFLTSLILSSFHAHLAGVLVLAAFVPSVLAMGGNAGIQSSALTVRRIALGSLEGRSVLGLLGREIAVGGLMGIICGAVIGLWAHFMIGRSPVPADYVLSPLYLAMVVALAMFSAMTFAAMFGALVPIVLDRMHIDPAVASGPFITTTNDITALLIYFGVTVLLIHGATP